MTEQQNIQRAGLATGVTAMILAHLLLGPGSQNVFIVIVAAALGAGITKLYYSVK